MTERNLFDEIQSGLIEIRDYPEKLRRIELPLSVGTRNRYIKHSVHKLRRDAIDALH